VWDWQEPGVLVHFAEDGTYAIAPSPYDFSLGSSYASGTWRLEGDVLTLESNSDSLFCEGAEAVYQVQTLDDEQMVFVQQSDGCEPRAIEDGAQMPPLFRTDLTISDEVEVMDVAVGDRQLSMHCEGTGSPTVLLESGLLDTWTVWWEVQPGVAEFTRVCSYTRAEPQDGETRTGQQFADDLCGLVKNAGVEGPYVLVGHSIGGYFARVYADQYPDEVVGMVLVDSSHEDQRERYAGVMPEEMYQEILEFEAERPEGIDFAESAAQVKATSGLGDLPLVVLSAHEATDPDMPAEVAERLDEVWLGMQAELASLSSDSTHIIAEESGHNIHVDQPELVIDAIQQVTEAAQTRSE
jgi:pimeloyl-ACP methyl ester carboxylesterase